MTFFQPFQGASLETMWVLSHWPANIARRQGSWFWSLQLFTCMTQQTLQPMVSTWRAPAVLGFVGAQKVVLPSGNV